MSGTTMPPVDYRKAPPPIIDFQVQEEDTFSFERDLRRLGYGVVAGIDEVGRGPLAGPVVAASVILPPDCDYAQFKDSKKLSPERRKRLAFLLEDIGAVIGVGSVSEKTIDRINILQASLLAMRRSMESLATRPDFLLVDGKFPVPVDLPQRFLIKGESRSASIAAASIIAKVTRDGLMHQYHYQFPQYGFNNNMGYPTREHRKALADYGPCPLHRRTFSGVKELFAHDND
ncbi:MAG: ribonuclease HII [Desulfobulbaceae bacterium]|nr:ribonuclease HII [Desulfobulbaceae bacterium]